MQVWVAAHSSGVPSQRMVGLGCSSIGSDVDTDASRTRTSGGVGAEGTKGVSETGAAVAGTTVSPRSGSGVAALLTVVTEGTVVASGSIRWTPVRPAITVAGSPAPPCAERVDLYLRRQASVHTTATLMQHFSGRGAPDGTIEHFQIVRERPLS